MGKRILNVSIFGAMAALLLAALFGAPGIGAQGTPASSDESDLGPARPAHIHSGTCDDLGNVVHPLNDVAPLTESATPDAVIASPEADVRQAVPESRTIVDASLEDLLAEPHAINVHQSAEDIDTYIACGEITGDAGTEQVVIELNELNDSGYAGLATLLDNGDGTTSVSLTLFAADADTVATPAS